MKIKNGRVSAPFPRRSGKKIIYYYYAYDDSGKRVKRSTGAHSRAAAMAIIQDRIRTGTLISDRLIAEHNTPDSLVLGEYLTPFFVVGKCPLCKERELRGNPYTSRVIKENRQRLERYIIPFFEKFSATAIASVTIIKKWQTWLCEQELSNSTINRIRSTLSPILNYMVEESIIPSNPLQKVKPLYVAPKSDKEAFTIEDLEALFAVDWESKMARLATMLAAFTGMRIGEIRGIRTENIKDGAVVIEHSAERDGNLKCPKGKKARLCPIPQHLADSLLEMAAGRSGYIFTLTGVKPVSETYIRKHLYKAMEKAGIERMDEETGEKLSFHSTRHFLNTALVGANVSGELIRAAIGHESTAMTDRYLHLRARQMAPIQEAQREIEEALIKV